MSRFWETDNCLVTNCRSKKRLCSATQHKKLYYDPKFQIDRILKYLTEKCKVSKKNQIKSEFWGAHTAELTSRLFKMLDCSIFDSDALQMTRNFSKLLADGAAPPSVCEGLVSVSARIKNSRTIEQNWTEEPLLEAINRLISLCPQVKFH